MIVNLIFEGFILIWYNNLDPILGGIILIEMHIEVPIIWKKACITDECETHIVLSSFFLAYLRP